MPTVVAIPWNKGKHYPESIRAKMRGPRPSIAGSRNPMYGKHRTQEVRDAISRAQRERFRDPEERRKASDLNKGRKQSQESSRRKSDALKGKPAWNKGKHHTEEAKRKISFGLMGNDWNKGRIMPLEVRQKISQAGKLKYQDPHERLRDSEAVKLAHQNNPSLRHRQSVVHRKKWQDADYKERMLKAIRSGAHKRPTKPEKKLNNILQSRLPEYKYNGDYGLGITLSGLVPDFINIDGRKEIIEVFGDYWHKKKELKWHQTELGRIMAYQSVGYKCLIIWEHELEKLDEEQLVSKIKLFFRGTKNARSVDARRR